MNLINEFELIGQISDVKTAIRVRPFRLKQGNIARVAESAAENGGLSISRRSQELGISQASLHRILHKNLNLRAYKLQLPQQLKPADYALRRTTAELMLEMHEKDHIFFKLSDEANFHIAGYVNKQICRTWVTGEIVERLLQATRECLVWFLGWR